MNPKEKAAQYTVEKIAKKFLKFFISGLEQVPLQIVLLRY